MEIYKVYTVTNHSKKGKRVWEISNYGNVKCNGEKYEPHKNGEYLIFSKYLIHRAVAELFIENPENKPQVDHINTIRTDNRVENLRWVTQSENNNNSNTLKHMSEVKIGKYCGKNHPRAKAVAKCSLSGEILEIRPYAKAFEKDGFTSSNISNCCQGKSKTHKKFKWCYV